MVSASVVLRTVHRRSGSFLREEGIMEQEQNSPLQPQRDNTAPAVPEQPPAELSPLVTRVMPTITGKQVADGRTILAPTVPPPPPAEEQPPRSDSWGVADGP